MNQLKSSIYKYIFMYVAFFIYSLSISFLKLSSEYNMFSFKYFFYIIMTFIFIFIYAVAWQIILKYFPLSTAYMHRSSVLFFTMIISVLFFNETIKINNIIGIIIILFGLYMVTRDE